MQDDGPPVSSGKRASVRFSWENPRQPVVFWEKCLKEKENVWNYFVWGRSLRFYKNENKN
jgi:hypothetical protein